MCAVRFRASRTNGEGSDEGSSPVTSTITGVYAHPDERETDLSGSFFCITKTTRIVRGFKRGFADEQKTSKRKGNKQKGKKRRKSNDRKQTGKIE